MGVWCPIVESEWSRVQNLPPQDTLASHHTGL